MYPRRLKVYMIAVGLIAMGLMVFYREMLSHVTIAMAIFCLGVFLGAVFAIEMMRGQGEVSITLPVILAAGVVLGPGAGLWIGAVGTFTWREITGKVRWPSLLFNRAQFGITSWATAEVFRLLGGSPARLSIAHASGPLVVAAVTAFVLNLMFVIVAVALREDRSLGEIIRVYFKWMLPSFFVM